MENKGILVHKNIIIRYSIYTTIWVLFLGSPLCIFAEVAKKFLDCSRSLRILEGANSAEPALNLPSWVPDLSVLSISSLPYMGQVIFFNACKSRIAAYEIFSDSKELRVKGKEFDSVEKISTTIWQTYQKQHLSTQNKIPGWQE
jgi:hypothetical protein